MRPRILFVHSGNETFVKLDRELLSAAFEVHDLYAARKFPLGLFQYWRGVRQNDLVFCWFAGWNSFWALLIARLMRKASVLVIGGYDLANLPEADYGHQRGGVGKWVSRLAMRLAGALFTNSYYSQSEAEINAGIPASRVQVIYHGVADPFGSLSLLPKERMALTVGKVDRPNLKRKGLEPFVRAAAALPDVQFVLVGDWADDAIEYLRSIASPNVFFRGRVSAEELLDYYRKASVYVQASLHEGFGLSVAEAMLAGCIPVTTRAGSLPEVVGDCGIYLPDVSPQSISDAVTLAMLQSESKRIVVRQHILTRFPLSLREEQLVEIVGRILDEIG